MSYLQCPRCGLQIRIQAMFLRGENCPRCLARTATLSPLEESPRWVNPAARLAARARDRPDQQSTRRT